MSRRGYSKASQKEDRELQEIIGSLERSRKRNLSDGLLRGDQARDRLSLQEAGASPLLKRTREREITPPPGNMAMSMADFRVYMDENTNKTLKNLQTSLTQIDDAVKGNSARLDRQEATIRLNQAGVSELREEVRRLKDRPQEMSTPKIPRSRPNPTPPSGLTDEGLAEYTRARNSLRLWPIRGDSKEEIWRATQTFLTTNLRLGNSISENMIEDIVAARIPSGPGVDREAIITFKDARTRDLVMGSASKLAEYIDSNGKPTAGMRMEIPSFLQQEFRVLFRYGQTLRTRHGVGTRRHVKFDEMEKSLYLNVRLPRDDRWSLVSLEMAKRGLRTKELIDGDRLEQRLDIGGPIQDKPRSMSLGDNAGQPPGSSGWTGRRAESVSEPMS